MQPKTILLYTGLGLVAIALLATYLIIKPDLVDWYVDRTYGSPTSTYGTPDPSCEAVRDGKVSCPFLPCNAEVAGHIHESQVYYCSLRLEPNITRTDTGLEYRGELLKTIPSYPENGTLLATFQNPPNTHTIYSGGAGYPVVRGFFLMNNESYTLLATKNQTRQYLRPIAPQGAIEYAHSIGMYTIYDETVAEETPDGYVVRKVTKGKGMCEDMYSATLLVTRDGKISELSRTTFLNRNWWITCE